MRRGVAGQAAGTPGEGLDTSHFCKTKRPRRLVRAAGTAPGVGSGRDSLARLRHHRSQLLTGLEDRDGTSGHFDRIAGARVARHASLTLADLEGPKPAYLNVMLLSERCLHGVQEGVDDAGAVLF